MTSSTKIVIKVLIIASQFTEVDGSHVRPAKWVGSMKIAFESIGSVLRESNLICESNSTVWIYDGHYAAESAGIMPL